MFDRLIDLLVDFVQIFQFWVVIDEYERGVVLTLGKRRYRFLFWKRNPVLQPGFHWVIPFDVDQIFVDNVVPAAMDLGEQSLTTEDGVEIVIQGMVLWSINDIEKTVLKVEEVDDVLHQASCGIIGDTVADSTWKHIHANGFADEISETITKEADGWGVTVHEFRFIDLSKAPSLRLWNE